MKVRVTRGRILKAILVVLAAPFLIVGILAIFTPLPPELRETPPASIIVRARDGKVLREVRADDGTRARPLPIAAYPKRVTQAVLAAEDRRFYSHFGVDLLAVLRAAGSDLRHGHIVSGASTITMQLARTVRPHPRSMWGKIGEAALAVRIEWSLSKDEILEQYLNRVIYGPNVRGYAAASRAYFNRAPDEISLAEAALLAGLPRGPSLYQVAKRPELARKRRDRVLERMDDAGFIAPSERAEAEVEPLITSIDQPMFGAPHLVRGIINGSVHHWQAGLELGAGVLEVETTIDLELQRSAENAVTSALAQLTDKHVTAASVIAIDNASGDVLAWVGSPSIYDQAGLGQNDGVVAMRQPGSALKPFVYAEAMKRLGYTPATVLPDVEIHIPLPGGGDYVPHDYDEKQRGPVRLREALGSSLNIPAVDTIRRVGTENVLTTMHAVGLESLTEDAEHYGPALALGDGEITLLELARAYSTLARGGKFRPLRVVKSITRADGPHELEIKDGERVVDERIAAMLADVLSDKTARMSAFGDQNVLEIPELDVAVKTGTSKGYRDNVAVGFSRDITVAVWAGNFDGSSMQGVSGISGAGPIFRTVMTAAATGHPRKPLLSADAAARLGLARTSVCSVSGEIPTAACPHTIREWLPDEAAEHGAPCDIHVELRVDARNGLLAGPGCSASETQLRVFERWPAQYADWAERTNRPIAPTESSPNCPLPDAPVEAGTATGPVIAYPFDHGRFVIDPERPRDLQLLAIKVDPESALVLVDGQPIEAHDWQLAAGEHTIVARGGGKDSKPVRITVR